PRMKIARAREHIADLVGQLHLFSASKPFDLRWVNLGSEGKTRQGLKIFQTKPFPAFFALLIGDAVHNCRTALDLLACDLVRLNNKDAASVYFPFGKDEKHFNDQIGKGSFDLASPQAVSLLKQMKPYWGGDDWLRGLHELDLLDEHRLLLPVFISANVRHLVVKAPQGGEQTFADCTFSGSSLDIAVPEGSRIVKYKGVEPHISLQSQIEVFDAIPVIEVLENLADRVEHVVLTFENLLLR
ncbi:MAG TPA: hypothetical protein VET51_13175, partial [Burkholderiales bacterium]|nr:hypothetical protein [Burkholderiales bacterium]